MKGLTTAEKMSLVRYHGEALSRAFLAIQSPHRQDLIEHAEKVLALVKSIPKLEYAIEER